MELIPVGQGLKVVEYPEPPDRDGGLFVARHGRIARDEPLPAHIPPAEQRPTTHPVLDLIYRPDIRRVLSESQPPQPPRPVRPYPQPEHRMRDNVGSFLNVMV